MMYCIEITNTDINVVPNVTLLQINSCIDAMGFTERDYEAHTFF